VECGWFASPGQHSCKWIVDADNTIAETDETNNTKSFTFTPVVPTTLPQKLQNPMGGVPFHDWTFVNYVDVNPKPRSIHGFSRGSFQYDGHDAQDINCPTLPGWIRGFPSTRLPNGTVEAVVDGKFDRNTVWAGQPPN